MKNLMKSLILILFVIVFYASHAQYFEVKYNFNKLDAMGKATDVVDNEYQVLVYYNSALDTSHNVMRIRYLDQASNSWIIIEQKVKAFVYTLNNLNYYALIGSNPKFISNAHGSKPAYPLMIVLEKKPADSLYSPSFVACADIPNSDSMHLGKLSAFTRINNSDITNDYLILYSWKLPESKTPQTSYNFSGSTLYLIQVSNTMTLSDLRPGVISNHAKIQGIFSSIAKTCGVAFKPIEIKDYDFTKTMVNNTIANLSPGPNDIVIFYYSGHGFRWDDQTNNDWPNMALIYNDDQTKREITPQEVKDNSLNLNTDVFQPLSTKGEHLLLVIGETCNTPYGTNEPLYANPVKMATGEDGFDPNTMKTLLQQQGKFMVATAKPQEETTYFSEGGIFCSNFIYFLCHPNGLSTDNSTPVTWQNVLQNSMNSTYELTNQCNINPTDCNNNKLEVEQPIAIFTGQ